MQSQRSIEKLSTAQRAQKSSDKVAIPHLLSRHYFVQRISKTCPQGFLILDKEETLGKGFRVSAVEICCGQNIDCYFKVENV